MVPTKVASRAHRFLGEWSFLLAGLLMLGAYLGYGQYREYQQVDSLQRERLAAQAQLIERNLTPRIEATSRAIDGILDGLPSWHLEKGRSIAADERLHILGDTLSGIRVLLIIGADGRVLSSNKDELIGLNFSQRDYFQNALRSGSLNTLNITPPFKTVLDTFVITFGRAISGPGGEFAGVVIASVDPEYFKTLLDSARYAPDSRTFLIHGDGKVFMVAPERPDLDGRSLATPGSLFTRHRSSGQMVSVFAERAYITGEERMSAFRTIQPAHLRMDKPLVVVVSRDLPTIFAAWRRESRIQNLMFGSLCLLSIPGLFLYQRRQRVFDRLDDSQKQALRTSEARLHSLFDATPDALLISDAQGTITMANRQAERLLGYTLDEMIGQPIELLLPDRFRSAHPALRAQFATSQQAVRRMGHGLNVKARRKDGSECDVEVSLGRIETDQGLYFASALRDITERKHAEEQLRIAATAFEAQESMVITDANEVILRVNQAFTDTTGYSAEEAVGQTPRLLQSGRQDRNFYAAMWEIIDRTGGWQGEVWDRRKNGEVYPKWLTISSVKDEDGTVTHYVGTHFDISERKQAEEKIRELAYFDQLTELPNRTLLLDRLKQVMAASDRGGSYGALLFIDLDNFKTLNDTLGHGVGDKLLKQVAQRLTQCVREVDTVARLGGDEFVVILANLGANEKNAAIITETVAEKILAVLNQSYRLGDVAHHSTASIGAALFKGSSISTDDLMKQADLTMYKAKEAGRNTVRFFDPAMEAAVRKRVVLESDLRRAVETQCFRLHYQAQVAGDGRVTGAEALLRWQHPQRGMVSPVEFIPLAEETGLILPLGQWVLETACKQLAEWASQPAMAHLTLAVNVSAHQFVRPDFVDQVLAVLKDSGANPLRLKLELTESLLLDNVEATIEKMTCLKASGVGFSLDDFGIGYSSLSYLKRLPLDQLKIDQSFVRDVLVDPNDASIVRTIIALAQNLGLAVIAEGVETAAQRDFLANAGCHDYQGYFFGRPVPLKEFEAFVRQV